MMSAAGNTHQSPVTAERPIRPYLLGFLLTTEMINHNGKLHRHNGSIPTASQKSPSDSCSFVRTSPILMSSKD